MLKLTAQSLRCARGGRVIIANLSFALGAGGALILRGPNGAGKSTLLRTIAGFLKPLRGAVTLEGGEAEKSLAEQCHFIGHLNAVKASLSVFENLRFTTRFFEAKDETAIDAALQLFGLGGMRHLPAAYLSAGQKRRLALARLVAVKRPLWLLDEPTVSLDAASSEALARAIRDHLASGGIAIAATHTPLDLGAASVIELGRDGQANREARP